MTAAEAFKVGFLLRCADTGMSGDEAAQTMQKAAVMLEKRALGWADIKGPALGTLATGKNLAMGFGLVAPIVTGAGLGILANEAASPEVDDDDVRTQELIDELKHYARRAREQQSARTMSLPA